MALPELRQAHAIIERATRVLLIVPQRPTLDALASMIALYLALQPLKEEGVDEVSPSHVPAQLQFLPGSSQVQMQPRLQPEVALDIAGPADTVQLRSVPLQGGVRVYITLPEQTSVTKDQLEVTVRALPYDAVVVLGAADLAELGELYAQHTDFFFSTPIINIDHQANNEYYGTVNLVDITAGSVAEATYDLVTSLVGETVDTTIATALYAGIVAGTDSFQRPSTTPRSFQVAARLMELDADRSSVIQHLVKTKPLQLLKLSGRLYARLRYDEHAQIFWTMVRPLDFRESGASPDDIVPALQEVLQNITGYNAVFVLHEQTEGAYAYYLAIGKGLSRHRQEIQANLSAEQLNSLLYAQVTASSLEAAEQQVLQLVRQLVP